MSNFGLASETVVLITGAGRGIGKGLVERYLQRPNHVVIGSVRDANAPKYNDLKNASLAAEGSRLILVKIDSSSLDDPVKAIEAAQTAGISKIDIVIANAGISPPPGPFNNVPISDITEAFNINTLSPIALYQAARPLLEQSEKPRWLSVSSAAGSITNLEPYQAHYIFAYGVSKAAMNFFTMAVHASQPQLIAYAIHPGLVQTDLGNQGAAMQGMEKAPITLEESCSKIMSSLDNATRERTSGRFINVIDGEELPW